jgi:DNA-directed RNA polymerase specialized sigma subunit
VNPRKFIKQKKFLQLYRESIEKTSEIAQNLAELKAEAEALRDHEGQRVELDAAVAKYVDACEEAEKELSRLADLRQDIRQLIDKVNDTRMHSILWRRYISGLSWEQVAVSMNYTYRRVTQLHGEALKEICSIQEMSH